MNLFTHTKNSPSLDSNQIGGKAFYLQKIQKANLKVPNFIILSVDLINTILLPIRDTNKPRHLLSSLFRSALSRLYCLYF